MFKDIGTLFIARWYPCYSKTNHIIIISVYGYIYQKLITSMHMIHATNFRYIHLFLDQWKTNRTFISMHLLTESLIINCGSYTWMISDYVNSSPPSAAYMRQWTGSALAQIMAWRLYGAKPLSESMLAYCQSHPKQHVQWNFIWHLNIFIQENAFEHVVCEMVAILSRGR